MSGRHHLVQLAPWTSPGEHFKSSLKTQDEGRTEGEVLQLFHHLWLINNNKNWSIFCLYVLQCYLSAWNDIRVSVLIAEKYHEYDQISKINILTLKTAAW